MNAFIILSKLNSVELRQIGQPSEFEKLANWEYNIEYFQKFNNSDFVNIQLQVLTTLLQSGNPIGVPTTIVASLKDINDNTVKTFNATIKNSSVVSNYTTYEVKSNLSNVPEGTYYYYLNITQLHRHATFISEAIYIKETHDNTILLSYTHDENDYDTIFDNTFSPAITFYFRVEGGLNKFYMQLYAKETIYVDDPHNYTVIDSVPYETEKLVVSDSYGVANWVAKKINRMLSCLYFYIDGIRFCKYENAKWERKGLDQEYPFSGWMIDVVESENKYSNEFNADNFILTPGGVWDDTGVWDDDGIWNDNQIGIIINTL